MNKVRRVMKDIYGLRIQDNPPMTDFESMRMICSESFTDANEWVLLTEEAKK